MSDSNEVQALRERLSRLEAAERARARRRVALGVVAALGAGAVVSGVAFAQAGVCTQTLPGPLVTLCANAPARASDLNGNFQTLHDWLEQKVGPPDAGANVTFTGTLNATGPVNVTGRLSAGAGVQLGTPATCSAGTANTVRTNNGQLELCNGTMWLAVTVTTPATETCKTIKTAFPMAGDGNYNLVVNGETFVAYCDMTTAYGGFTGGWTAIQSHAQFTNPQESRTVTFRSSRYLPGERVRSLALASTEVMMNQPGLVLISADSLPITRLRDLKVMTEPSGNEAHWLINFGSYTLSRLNPTPASCPPGAQGTEWPAAYHACGTMNGPHILPDLAGLPNIHSLIGYGDTDVNVFVR